MTYLLHGSANVTHDSAPNFQPDGVEHHLCKLLIRLYDCLVPSTKIDLSVKLIEFVCLGNQGVHTVPWLWLEVIGVHPN